MKLHVYYDDIKKTFEGNDIHKLFGKAKKDKLYEEHQKITFELEDEEVDEDGN